MFANRFAHKPAITPVAGQRAQAQLDAGVRTLGALLRITADYAIGTNPAASIRNRGSALALLGRVGINVDGDDRIIADARALKVAVSRMQRDAGAFTRLASTAVASTALDETLYIPAALPQVAKREEMALTEQNPRVGLYVFAEANLDATRIAVAGGGGTVAVTNPRITVTHIYDTERGELPLLRPSVRQVSQPVAAAGEYEIPLTAGKYLAGILVQQDSDAGEVTDIITAVSLIGDDGRSPIPQAMPWADFSRLFGPSDSGALIGGGAYGSLDMIDGGRLSKQLHPYSVNNLRLRISATPSVTAGATNSRVNVTIFETANDPQLTAPALPFAI